MADRFEEYRAALAAAIESYREHAAAAQQWRDKARAEVTLDRAAHPSTVVAGLVTPVEVDVNLALKGNPHYEYAKAQRDAARLTALMWAAGALVEAQARR